MSLDVPLEALPTLTDLESAFRRVRAGKAMGTDGIPPELCKGFPVLMARLGSHAQAFASWTRIFGTQRRSSCAHLEAQRSPRRMRQLPVHFDFITFWQDPIHRAIRQKQATLYEGFLHRDQLGGRAHVPVTLGTHLGRAFLRHQQERSRSAGLLFVDLTEAFYRVIRPLVIAGDLEDDLLASVAHRLHLPEEVLHDFHAMLQQPDALAQAHLPDHLARALQALHCDTHFHVGTQQDCVRTRLGTRPGDSFADVIFGYLFADFSELLMKTYAPIICWRNSLSRPHRPSLHVPGNAALARPRLTC